MKSKKPRLVNVPQLVIPKDATPEEAARMAKEFLKKLKEVKNLKTMSKNSSNESTRKTNQG